MLEELNRKGFHKAVDATLSGLQPDPLLYRRVAARMREGEGKVKRKVSATLVITLIIVMMGAVAVAATLLSHQEVVEQIAIPMAVHNDGRVGVNPSYTVEELGEVVRTLNENGITLEENSTVMQLLQNGQGYYEEETLMEICRLAFGGNYFTWTLEQQDWFEGLMVQCGFHETHIPRMPGSDNMTYEDAEAFAFERLRQAYGQELAVEDRTQYRLSRQFYHDIEQGGRATWSFTLEPLNVLLGRYHIQFVDEDPESTVEIRASIPDWTKPYTGDQLLGQFTSVHSWDAGRWPQSVWQHLHAMMQGASLSPDDYSYTVCKGCLLTDYPEETANEITRDEAIRIGREALHLDRAAFDSAVLTEYEGSRAWLVGMVINQAGEDENDEEAGSYVIAIDSASGQVQSIRKSTADDDASFAFVPQAAYEKAWEGVLKSSDYIRIAREALEKAYPSLDMEAYTISDRGGQNHLLNFASTSIHQGNASVTVTAGGAVLDVSADTQPLTGDNIIKRFSSAYGFFGHWHQDVWVQLGQEMEALHPTGYESLPLKQTSYPREDTVTIRHERAQDLAIIASGKRTAEVNTCVLVSSNPHPVWIIRLITDEPDDPVYGVDAETGDILFTEHYKTDYTPRYVLYSLPETWRAIELEHLGAAHMAKIAITHSFGDMWLDEPEIDVDDVENWELQQDGLIVRYIGRWAGMDSYEVELDQSGFVLRCEKTRSPSTAPKPDTAPEASGGIIPTPTPQPDGKPWFFSMDFADAAFWAQMESKMAAYGVTAANWREKEQEWTRLYGASDQWPLDCQVLEYFMSQTDARMLQDGYPIFPHEGKKNRDEIYVLAREAFHQEADAAMGAAWVDQLRCSGMMWSDGYDVSTGEVIDEPIWYINMQMYDEEHQYWCEKGFVILNEDGVVLNYSLELASNG